MSKKVEVCRTEGRDVLIWDEGRVDFAQAKG